MTLRLADLSDVARPVMRIRNVPLDMSIIDSWLFASHVVAFVVCRSSMAYSAGTPGILRQTRGSVGVFPSHCWLIGLCSVPFGLATFAHCVHTSGFSRSFLR